MAVKDPQAVPSGFAEYSRLRWYMHSAQEDVHVRERSYNFVVANVTAQYALAGEQCRTQETCP